MAIQRTEAVVLKTQAFRSSSLIVTFFTRDFGKLRGLVKGVRREGELRGAVYELFTHVDMVFYEKTRSDLHLVSEASILESHDPIRQRLEGIAYGSYFSELVDALTVVHDPHAPIFDLLEFAFRFLPSLPGPQLCRVFEIKLLGETGWLPSLEGCLHCGQAVLENGFFSIAQGALVCPACKGRDPDARPMTVEALLALRYLVSHSPEDCLRHRVGRGTDEELASVIRDFLMYRLPGNLKTPRFLEAVRPLFT